MAQVVEHLLPEPGVQQVQHRVLHTADVQVDTAGIDRAVLGRARAQPVLLVVRVDEPLAVGRIHVAQLIPAGACPVRHRVGVPPVALRPVANVQGHLDPVGGTGQRRRRLGVRVVGVERLRRVVVHLR